MNSFVPRFIRPWGTIIFRKLLKNNNEFIITLGFKFLYQYLK